MLVLQQIAFNFSGTNHVGFSTFFLFGLLIGLLLVNSFLHKFKSEYLK